MLGIDFRREATSPAVHRPVGPGQQPSRMPAGVRGRSFQLRNHRLRV